MGKQRTGIFLLSFFLFFLLELPVAAQPPLVAVFDYIDTYSDLAVEQMSEYRIPASVILAQAIFESASGTSALARKSNNHFGIKCHRQWEGDTAVKTDDELNECFRKYESIGASFSDHSRFLASRKRYAHLFSLPLTDYRSWCVGIKKAGYATYPFYAEELIRIIERYELFRLDRPSVLHPVTLSAKPAQLKKTRLRDGNFDLIDFARHGLLWVDEREIHLRSLNMLMEAATEEDIPVAGN